jgi:hypothetical protein
VCYINNNNNNKKKKKKKNVITSGDGFSPDTISEIKLTFLSLDLFTYEECGIDL